MPIASEKHDLRYDGKTSELYKIFILNLLLSVLTLGIYHFWGKTRKRRYITSSFILEEDRFEYTGYGSELFLGLIIGLILLSLVSLPLVWALYEIDEATEYYETHKAQSSNQNQQNQKMPLYFEQQDPFKKNRLVGAFSSLTNFWIKYNYQGFYIKYEENLLDIKWSLTTPLVNSYLDAKFKPLENYQLLIAIFVVPLYLIFYIIFLPFVIVYGSLRYRVSRLRWRGIRGHLAGSSLLYGLMGLWQFLLKVITFGFWIPISDLTMLKLKIKNLFFGNQQASFTPNYKTVLAAHLATMGASIYVIAFCVVLGYLFLPMIASYTPEQERLTSELIYSIIKESYFIFLFLLIWICYFPRYWYRAALLREKYNSLYFGNLQFHCNARGYEYFKLFILNDLIFIFTLSFGLPLIWQRRMKFFSEHVQLTGNLSELDIEQAQGKKTKFGGGFASIMNLEIGLI